MPLVNSKWVNGTDGVPTPAQFTTTGGLGPPICIDRNSGIPYYLINGIVVPLAVPVVTVKTFGAVGDDITNDGPAFVAAIAYLKSIQLQSTDGQGSTRLIVPQGKYYLGTTTLDITHGLIIEGESVGEIGGQASQLRWAAGATGIRVQQYNTVGASSTYAGTPNQNTGSGTIIRNLALKGGFTTTEADFHGIHLRARAAIRDVRIENFEGDGIFIKADSGQPYAGNANDTEVVRASIATCRNGLYIEGGDTNAGTFVDINAVFCRQWGIWDRSFLGNTFVGCHASSNSRYSFNLGTASAPCSFVSQGGNRYFCIRGQEAGASANAPTGAATDNAWWAWYSAGGADAPTGVVAWSGGMTVRAGGAYLIEGTSNLGTMEGPYWEADQTCQFDQAALILNPKRDSTARAIGVSGGVQIKPRIIGASTNGIEIYATARFQQGINSDYNVSNFGFTAGAVADNFLYLNSTNVIDWLVFQSWAAGVPQRDGTIFSFRGNGLFIDGLASLNFRLGDPIGAGSTLVADIPAVNVFRLAAGVSMKVGANQVITARQTGWTAATGTATRATFATGTVTLPVLAEHVKALIDDLMTHGVIGA